MIVYVVLNVHRAIIYAGDDRSRVDDLLRQYALTPDALQGYYAEKWIDGVPEKAWSRASTYGEQTGQKGWVTVDY